MDLDLLSDIMTDHQPVLTGSLLSDLQSRGLTDHNTGEISRLNDHGSLSKTINYRSGHPNEAGAVISKIEDIFESIVESVLDEKKEMVIRLKTRRKSGMHVLDSDNGTVKRLPDDRMRAVRFPSKSPQEAWKFSK